MFGIGGFELFIILLFGFLVFGPDKLPEIARTVGAALRKFKQAQEEMEAVIKDEVIDPEKPQAKKSTPSGARASAKPQPKSASAAASGESFAQRKARFDKERSAQEQNASEAQRIEDNRRAMKDAAAKKAAEAQPQSHPQKQESTSATSQPPLPDQAKAQGADSAAPSLTPDELFGLKPVGLASSQDGAQPVKSAQAQKPTTAGQEPRVQGAAANQSSHVQAADSHSHVQVDVSQKAGDQPASHSASSFTAASDKELASGVEHDSGTGAFPSAESFALEKGGN